MARVFIEKTNQDITMGIIVLTIFSVSALICGVIALAYPIKLGMNKKIKAAIAIVLWTAGFLFAYLVLAIPSAYLLSTEKSSTKPCGMPQKATR